MTTREARLSALVAAAYPALPPGVELLRSIRRARAGRAPVSDRTLATLEEALQRVLAGAPAAKVFGLGRGRGHPRDRTIAARNLAIYFRLAELRYQGEKELAAIARVAREFGTTKGIVGAVYEDYVAGLRPPEDPSEVVIYTTRVLHLPPRGG
jgi:hypothetical protein